MKKIFTLFAAVAAFASVNAQQLYLVGDINSWTISNPIAMTLGADGKTNTYELNLSKAQNIFVVLHRNDVIPASCRAIRRSLK